MKKLLLVALISLSFLANAQQWVSIGNVLPNEGTTMVEYNGELIIGGWFSSPSAAVCKTTGYSFSSMGNGLTGGGTFNSVNALCVYNGVLYAGGTFTASGSTPLKNIAKWNGTSWSSVGTGVKGGVPVTYVFAMAVFNNELYVGGIFDSVGGIAASNIAKWDGNSWSSVGTTGTGFTIGTGVVHTITVHNNELYIGGTFSSVDGVAADDIAKWNGTSWSAVGTSNTISGGPIYAMASDGTDLFVGGQLTTINSTTVNNIARWDGTSWNAMGNGADKDVRGLFEYNGNIYAGGYFYNMDGVANTRHVAKWDGSSWSAMHVGMDTSVYAFAVYGWSLYATGAFTMASGSPSSYIAKWDGLIGINDNDASINNSRVYPNPVTDKAYINIEAAYGDQKNISVVLYDVTGRAIRTIANPMSNIITIDRVGLPSGLYFYQISNGPELLARNKFTVE